MASSFGARGGRPAPINSVAVEVPARAEVHTRGTQWVVFEPNDKPLWSQIRLNIGAFLKDLIRQGAFQGSPVSEAYFAKCNIHNITHNAIDRSIVNIEVGFAPLKPAEFVAIRIQQIAGQVKT